MWTIDESRHARESLPPATYLSSSYYEIWTRALAVLLARHGMVTPEEAERGVALAPPSPVRRVLGADQVARTLAHGGPCDRLAATEPAFAVGASVRTMQMNPDGHTRLPRYARDKAGVIEAVRGVFVYPDTNASWRRRGSAVALHRALHGARALGRGGERAGHGQHRRLRAVPPCAVGLRSRIPRRALILRRRPEGTAFRRMDGTLGTRRPLAPRRGLRLLRSMRALQAPPSPRRGRPAPSR